MKEIRQKMIIQISLSKLKVQAENQLSNQCKSITKGMQWTRKQFSQWILTYNLHQWWCSRQWWCNSNRWWWINRVWLCSHNPWCPNLWLMHQMHQWSLKWFLWIHKWFLWIHKASIKCLLRVFPELVFTLTLLRTKLYQFKAVSQGRCLQVCSQCHRNIWAECEWERSIKYYLINFSY